MFGNFIFHPVAITLTIIISLNIASVQTTGFTCETPESWLETAAAGAADNTPIDLLSLNTTVDIGNHNDTIAAINPRQGRKWPDGVVTYKLHQSLSETDIVEVRKAFEEFELKTCIRFKPWKHGDLLYTSIETDNTVCGLGTVCMQSGYQFAKFGNGCRSMQTMIHELGHNLCLDHEQIRSDRDKYTEFGERCKNDRTFLERNKNKRSNPIRGIYDYSSQMHYTCQSCLGGWPKNTQITKCGQQVTKGLSLLDADHLNELYNCQGCFRHRWRYLDLLTSEDRRFMYSFGYSHRKGNPLYPCRAFLGGEITIGNYDDRSRTCYVPWGGKEYGVRKNVQVLTIPGGLEQFNSQGNLTHRYELVNIRSISMERLGRVGVPGGRLPESSGIYNGDGVGYIAFASTTVQRGSELQVEDIIGKVWKRNGEEFPIAHFARYGREHVLSDNFKVLVCKSK